MTVSAVLNAAADSLKGREEFRVERDLRNGAGPAMFELLYETAKQLYGWTAIEHLQRHLGATLPTGQIQHWQETDQAAVLKALRAAAGETPPVDLETETLRAKLGQFHGALAEAMGWLVAEPAVLVRETVAEVERLRKDNERLIQELTEERRQHQITAQASWTVKEQNDEPRAQLGLPDASKPLAVPPVTIRSNARA